jgi:hypothetical protein
MFSLLPSFDPRYRNLRPLVLNLSRVNFTSLNNGGGGYQNRGNFRRQPLLQQPSFQQPFFGQSRSVGMLVARYFNAYIIIA